ncbi:hypothetical protein A6R68_24121 [Neotoma lepida]|uniref:Uncharacterized protein n=1 Tax=Neotoma lepida TaxID=56216 RepID=A0A1A6HUI7_NEOLE|nr:hypothetical protein A6R68_24121 [Neotoma lepida]
MCLLLRVPCWQHLKLSAPPRAHLPSWL